MSEDQMMFLFWDLRNDSLEILGEDGNFYGYGEDVVAIDKGFPEGQCRYWMKICKISEVTPLNSQGIFEVFDPILNDWVKIENTDIKTYRSIFKLAGAVCYE